MKKKIFEEFFYGSGEKKYFQTNIKGVVVITKGCYYLSPTGFFNTLKRTYSQLYLKVMFLVIVFAPSRKLIEASCVLLFC